MVCLAETNRRATHKHEPSKPMTSVTKRLLLFAIVLSCFCSWGILMIVRSENIIEMPVEDDIGAPRIRAVPQKKTAAAPRIRNVPQHTKTAAPRITPIMAPQKKAVGQPDFYQFIIDNNLFRPLGYRPPRPAPNYQFIGTIISENDVDTKAIILDLSTRVLHTAGIDERIGEKVTVKEIKKKQVILVDTTGDMITLHKPHNMFMRY